MADLRPWYKLVLLSIIRVRVCVYVRIITDQLFLLVFIVSFIRPYNFLFLSLIIYIMQEINF